MLALPEATQYGFWPSRACAELSRILGDEVDQAAW